MKNKGQTLVEIVVAVGIAVLVVGALTVAATNSIRNAQLSRNQTQATRLAQDAVEQARAMRDKMGYDAFILAGSGKFGTDEETDQGNCVGFNLDTSTIIDYGTTGESIPDTIYLRCVTVFPTKNLSDAHTVHVTITWSDALGDHAPGSELTTYLTKWE